jgi:hypothetical protein
MGELHHPATKLQEFGAAPTFVDYRPHARQFAAGMSARLRLNKHLAYPGDVVFQHACKMGSKRLGSRYVSGRSKDWLKFKNPEAPAVRRRRAAVFKCAGDHQADHADGGDQQAKRDQLANGVRWRSLMGTLR